MHTSVQFEKENNKESKSKELNRTRCFGQADEAKGSEVSGEAATQKELKDYSQRGVNDLNVE